MIRMVQASKHFTSIDPDACICEGWKWRHRCKHVDELRKAEAVVASNRAKWEERDRLGDSPGRIARGPEAVADFWRGVWWMVQIIAHERIETDLPEAVVFPLPVKLSECSRPSGVFQPNIVRFDSRMTFVDQQAALWVNQSLKAPTGINFQGY